MSRPRPLLHPTYLVLFFFSLACVVALTTTASDGNPNRRPGSGHFQRGSDFNFALHRYLSAAGLALLNLPNTSGGGVDSRDTIAVHAAGRGNPWINLSDGLEIPIGYTGSAELEHILDQNLARPLALASADFDEDGVPDLIGGYAGSGGGIITLHRGNIDSIYANAPEAQQRRANGTHTDSPFLSPAHVFEIAEAADFLGAGDFDADSHLDVLTAARSGNALWLLPGDGHGGFGVARRIHLPGLVTTLVTGEMNRPDGLTDVVVGVLAADGPRVLVFESSDGALQSDPEAYSLSAAATALALGRLDSGYTMDLAVGAGSDLIVVYGRDRNVSLDKIRQAEVPDANIGRRSFPFAIRSAAIGDFRGDDRVGLSLLSDDGAVYLLSGGKLTEQMDGSARVEEWKSELLARGPWPQAAQLVCARVSSTPVDNLLVLDSASHKLHVVLSSSDPRQPASGAQMVPLDVEGEPLAVLPMRLNVDAVSDLVILRKGQSAPTITMSGFLALFTVTNTNDSGAGSLRQAILDANGHIGLDMIDFDIQPAGPKTIAPLSPLPTITDAVLIDATTQPGFAGNPIIQISGFNTPPGNNGLSIIGGNSVVQGLVINRFNLNGLVLATNGGNVIAGNYFGTSPDGNSDLGNNRDGVAVSSANNTIGGTAASARNIISGNNSVGITISGSGATGNLVQGNYIGTDVSGTGDLGNTLWGVDIRDAAANNTIGGTAAGARNLISGNDQDGILIIGFGGGVTGNLVQGNFIGTDVNGTADLGNAQDGISITFGASSTTIGGISSGAGNTIAFNGGDGVFIEPDSDFNGILSNSIHSNSGLGIDLSPNGVTANDACDPDSGANNVQNFPILTLASTTSIQGTLNSTANTTFTIQFFSNTSCDEGQTLVGSMSVTTNATCNASFNFWTSLTPGQFITATATDPSNNTSEFSSCRVVTGSSLQFSSASFTAGETAGTTLITATRSGDSSGAASVQFSTASGGTATGGASCTTGVDYVSTSGTLNWAAGDSTNKTFLITICNDTVFEGTETVNLALSNAAGATLGTPNTATLTITDNDSQPTISITDVTQPEGHSATTAFGFTVSLSNPSTQTVTVNYTTANGTATAGGDYQGTSATTLTFNPGITSQPVNVLVSGDTLDEDDETFFVNLSSPANATIAGNQGLGTIIDDDELPHLTVTDVSLVEGNSGTTSFNFTVNLSAASGRTVTVNYATDDGTGTAGTDYQGIGITALTFTPGQTGKTVTVLVNGDTANELDETFFVDLSGVVNANITDSQGQGTILNDDAAPALSINDVSVTEGNSGTVNAVFTVSLSPASGQTVTVNYATANGTASAASDYQAINGGALTFSPGETSKPATVLVIGDTLNESNETFFLNLTNAVNATIADGQGAGTITNDDPVPTGNLTISGRIVDNSGLGISGQLVILGGAESGSTITDSSGNYSFANLSAGNYTVTASSGNHSFSPTTYSFNNLSVDRIAHFVGTQTVVSITGRVTDSNDTGLGSVPLSLSMNGTLIGTMSTDSLGNYGFGNLPAGTNYVVTPVGSFSPSSLFFNSLSTNAIADFKAVPGIPPTSAAISGRAADANNNALANITVTLSGPVTRVTSTDGAGNYSFANLAPGGNYAVTIQNNYFVFSASRADFLNLSGSQIFNFKAAPVVVPSPLPPPSDDFDGPTRDPNKWNLGIQTQPASAFDPLVNVAQINGELVITPLSQVSGPHFNGYVSANSFDLRGGSVSVELVQAATGGADTIFAVGSDLDNFYRFMVQTAGPGSAPALTGKDGIERPRNTTVAQLAFQVNVGGQLTALSIPYDPVQHRFMRFRHDAPANAILFETSPNSVDFTERHRVVLTRSVSALTAELSAGTSNPANPGMTAFDNFGLVTSTFQFSSASYSVEEGSGSILITVTRAGSTATTGTVDYATADGTALQTTKYINAAGRLTFAPGEASKTFRVLIIDNAQAEGNQNLNLLLQEPSASGLNTPGRAVLTIIDNDTTVPTSNPLENPTFFVTQHYYDFLNREADAPGLAFWVNQITGCGSDTQCIEIRRINVSAAYFLSIEFQETGFLVHRFYNLALNRPNGLPRYLEFFRDTQAIGNGVIVGAPGWEALLETNRVSYANEFAVRAEFTALYPLTQSAEQYVDSLYSHALITPSATERQAAIDEFSTPAGARGRVLRRIAENRTLSAREFNRAFVLAQYFGYLRRNPDDAPDNNLDGYNFWLNKLNQFSGNFVDAEMVKAFITSGEYRQRFGP